MSEPRILPEQSTVRLAFASLESNGGLRLLPLCPELGSNIGHLKPGRLRERGPQLRLLVIVLPLLFRSAHLQVRFPACLQKKWAAQGKRGCVGHCPHDALAHCYGAYSDYLGVKHGQRPWS